MAKAVLDTNVVVSGLRNPEGSASNILRLAEAKAFRCYVSQHILNEYEQVLSRPGLGLQGDLVGRFMRMAKRTFYLVSPAKRVEVAVDVDDNVFLECALAARADYVVTGNLRHFPPRFQDIRMVSPRQFLIILASQE